MAGTHWPEYRLTAGLPMNEKAVSQSLQQKLKRCILTTSKKGSGKTARNTGQPIKNIAELQQPALKT
jgi:hypothetical protein